MEFCDFWRNTRILYPSTETSLSLDITLRVFGTYSIEKLENLLRCNRFPGKKTCFYVFDIEYLPLKIEIEEQLMLKYETERWVVV